MMDNLPAQEVAGVREAIEATGAMLRHFAAPRSDPRNDVIDPEETFA